MVFHNFASFDFFLGGGGLMKYFKHFNPLNAELNPICHLLGLLGAHHILHISGIRIKNQYWALKHLKRPPSAHKCEYQDKQPFTYTALTDWSS